MEGKIEKKSLQTRYNISNFILFVLFLILFFSQNRRCLGQEHYIEIKVNKKGDNQILSDEYIGTPPSETYIDGNSFTMVNKIVKVQSTDNII